MDGNSERGGSGRSRTWVPDVTSASFRAEAHRQSLAVATSTGADEDQAFIDAVSDWRGDIEPK
ncbi:antitoxin MazE-like protein [Bradyrhizobium sp. RT6a]|uniref:antitoxin MazE-like protein n=1 Tax=unclassified Bradyrhizobium TaxID=2631580 RepID=UPI003390FAED